MMTNPIAKKSPTKIIVSLPFKILFQNNNPVNTVVFLLIFFIILLVLKLRNGETQNICRFMRGILHKTAVEYCLR